jgi:hypothetical protein
LAILTKTSAPNLIARPGGVSGKSPIVDFRIIFCRGLLTIILPFGGKSGLLSFQAGHTIMSISGITGVQPVPFPQPASTPPPAAGTGTSAASTPAQQIAAGHHHHRPPVNGAGANQGNGAGQPAAATPPGGTGINTLA